MAVQKKNYTLKLGSEYEEMDDLDDKSATLSNKDSGHHNASTTYEDVEHGKKKGLVPSTNVTSGYEDIDEISSKNSRYYKSPKPVRRNTHTKASDENKEEPSPDIPEKSEVPVKKEESETISATSADVNKPPPKSMRRNTQGKLTDEPKEAAPPAIPEKSEELEIYLDSNAANSKSRNKVDDIYTVPCSNMSTLSRAAIASTSYSDNPLYTSVDNDLNVDNVYSEPDLQQPSKLSEKTPNREHI